ncbi:MarR family winged helix-turn-helix transcriptional regulator [Caulobacter sp. DWP3-1-3b2]|uniref:MarR family winged helix-turn-helix transcriptional regulator n=1 Tax=Caulobacter sp. DWP3-1-3b2 TaxID=2804643 RepID=UPI003CF2DCD4
MDATRYLIVPLLQGFEWFDESLQLSLRENGWPPLTRPESIVMMHVQMDIVRPSDIARSLRLTRQAVHVTIKTLVDRGVFEMADDPIDGRIKIVKLTPMGEAMRQDAKTIVDQLTDILTLRVGPKKIKALREAFLADWGEPVVCRLQRRPAAKKPRKVSAPFAATS